MALPGQTKMKLILFIVIMYLTLPHATVTLGIKSIHCRYINYLLIVLGIQLWAPSNRE